MILADDAVGVTVVVDAAVSSFPELESEDSSSDVDEASDEYAAGTTMSTLAEVTVFVSDTDKADAADSEAIILSYAFTFEI